MINPLQLALDLFDDWRGHAPRGDKPPAKAPAPPSTPRPPRAPAPRVAESVVPPPAPTIESERAALLMELRRSPHRRSLSIEVHPDLRVVVRAPARLPQREIDAFVSARAPWIAAQIEHFSRQPHAPLRPGFRDGDTHYYLGQAHRLALRPQAPRGVTVDADSLVIGGSGAVDPAGVERALNAWYRAEAEREFRAVLAACHAHPRFARYPCPALQIRAMRTRWGSLGSRRGMTLNLVLIQAPRSCIEFVVMHELCHLRYHGHGKGFYRLLDSVQPDWRARKRELEALLR